MALSARVEAWHLRISEYVKTATLPLWPAKGGFIVCHSIWKVCPYRLVLRKRTRRRETQLLGQGSRRIESQKTALAQCSDQSFAKGNRDHSLPSTVCRQRPDGSLCPFSFQHGVHWRERKIFLFCCCLEGLLSGLFLLQCQYGVYCSPS